MMTENQEPKKAENQEPKKIDSEFGSKKDTNLFMALLMFLWINKLWWMLPIVLILGLLILLMTFAANSGTAAPFIYTLF